MRTLRQLVVIPVAIMLLGMEAAGDHRSVDDRGGAELRCPSAICHNPQTMGRLTTEYRTCRTAPGADRLGAPSRLGCARAELSRQDRLRETLQGWADADMEGEPPDWRAIVTKANANWMVMRDRVCRAIAMDYPSGAAEETVETECRIYLTAERSLFLEHRLARSNP